MYLRGEDINIGVGMENPAARGTAVDPQMWIPGRTPTSIKPVIEKVEIKETRASGVDTRGSVIIQNRAEGDLEFNVRVNSIGYIFKSLFGKVTSSVVEAAAVWSHNFEVLPQNPQHPSLTLGLSQAHTTIKDYDYSLAITKSLELRTPVDDLVNMTVGFIASKETAHTPAFSPVFASNDYYFRHQDVVIKIADNISGLAAASALSLKEFTLTNDNNSKVNQNIGELNPGDVLSNLLSSKITLKGDYQDPATWRDLFTGGTYKAMSITMERTDIMIGTDPSQHPKIEIILPKVSIDNWTPDRPIEDIVTGGIEIKIHYDDTEAEAIEVNVVNETADYNHV